MKNIIGLTTMLTAVILALSLEGGYTSGDFTAIQFVIYEALALALGFVGYKMLDIKEG